MILKTITLSNYRNFENYSIELGSKTTMLIGRNGMGKTNLLSAMVQALSFIFSKQRDLPQTEFIRSSDQSVKRFSSTDARFDGDYQYPVFIRSTALLPDKTLLTWGLEQEGKRSGLRDSRFRDAYRFFWRYYNSTGKKPVFAFFSDGFPHKSTRISASMKERFKSGFDLPANTGYYQWDQDQSCVEIWKRYYTQQWLNNRLTPNASKAAYVEAVKSVLCSFSYPINTELDNDEMIVEDLFAEFRDSVGELMIKLHGQEHPLPFNSLPQGYNRLFSIVLDLASRSFLLNNGDTDPEGIVFIDEIELHLHPSVAISVLQRLQRSFPHLQFIVSTHSPLVVTNFDQSGNDDDYRLYQLRFKDGEYSCEMIADVFGLDYNEGLTAVMEARDRNRNMKQMKDLYFFWKKHDSKKAELIAAKIKEDFSHNIAFISSLGL